MIYSLVAGQRNSGKLACIAVDPGLVLQKAGSYVIPYSATISGIGGWKKALLLGWSDF